MQFAIQPYRSLANNGKHKMSPLSVLLPHSKQAICPESGQEAENVQSLKGANFHGVVGSINDHGVGHRCFVLFCQTVRAFLFCCSSQSDTLANVV